MVNVGSSERIRNKERSNVQQALAAVTLRIAAQGWSAANRRDLPRQGNKFRCLELRNLPS